MLNAAIGAATLLPPEATAEYSDASKNSAMRGGGNSIIVSDNGKLVCKSAGKEFRITVKRSLQHLSIPV